MDTTQTNQAEVITGKVHVQRGVLFDVATKPGKTNKLKVGFSLISQVNEDQNNSIQNYRIPNYHDDPQGIYQFVIDSSFTNQINSGNNADQFVDRIKEAFCEWNEKSELKLQIVDSCTTRFPNFLPCGKIKCYPIDATYLNTPAFTKMAYVTCETNPFIGEVNINFVYGKKANGTTPNKWFSNFVVDKKAPFDSLYIYDVALHEIGHVLQLGHVREKTSLMYFGVDGYKGINSASKDASIHMRHKSEDNSTCSASIGLIKPCMTSIANLQKRKDFIIYPTIVNSVINVNSEYKIKDIRLISQNGIIVYEKLGIRTFESTIPINLKSSGIYFVIIDFIDGSSGVQKIVFL